MQLLGGGESMAGGVRTTAESAEDVYRMRFFSGPVAFILALDGGPGMDLELGVVKPTTLKGSNSCVCCGQGLLAWSPPSLFLLV